MNPVSDSTANCDSEAARLLPWYLTGQLASSEAERVAAHLEGCAVCRADLQEQRRLRDLLRADDTVHYAPQAGLTATLARIDELERPDGLAATTSRRRERNASRRRPSPLTRWLAAAVIVQAVGLGVLSAAFLHRTPDGRGAAPYEVLSSAAPELGAPAFRAVLSATMSVGDLQSLLAREGLHVIAGPGAAGVYTLVYDGGAVDSLRVSRTLAALRANERVRFAEWIGEVGARAL